MLTTKNIITKILIKHISNTSNFPCHTRENLKCLSSISIAHANFLRGSSLKTFSIGTNHFLHLHHNQLINQSINQQDSPPTNESINQFVHTAQISEAVVAISNFQEMHEPGNTGTITQTIIHSQQVSVWYGIVVFNVPLDTL